ncbi:hypothetical protein INT47_005627 [Mucor saturninus]|uniref:Uncharacterized protein n=1 Tax=Mucor saturninus TaxID=64648 RepID=A0A8H7QMH8_9FUNG|nr:hypothetical protein INT47_005627 [Mucor saturninus]
MEELYDYSRHKYCITFDFDHDIMMSTKIAIDDDKEMPGPGETGGSQEDLFYVPNIFSELINIYLRSHQNEHDHIVIDKMVRQEAMDVLNNSVQRWKEFTDYSNEDFYYTFILPTTWDYKTREALIRPLFIEAGLIHGNDGQGRLIFFTKLDPIFQYLQGDVYRGINMNLKHGDRYIMCLLDFQGQFRVDLELVSVQYPALTTRENKYAPQLLKEAHFAIPFGSKEVETDGTCY